MNSKDYLLTADAAKVVMMGDDSEVGLALRWALVDLLNRIARTIGEPARQPHGRFRDW